MCLAENIAFLPGLLPIEPLFAVNWSLGYEWWFYASATLMFSVLGLSALPKAGRIGLILGLAGALITLSALDLPNVPIRGFPLFAGMLLVEYRGNRVALSPSHWPSVVSWAQCLRRPHGRPRCCWPLVLAHCALALLKIIHLSQNPCPGATCAGREYVVLVLSCSRAHRGILLKSALLGFKWEY